MGSGLGGSPERVRGLIRPVACGVGFLGCVLWSGGFCDLNFIGVKGCCLGIYGFLAGFFEKIISLYLTDAKRWV